MEAILKPLAANIEAHYYLRCIYGVMSTTNVALIPNLMALSLIATNTHVLSILVIFILKLHATSIRFLLLHFFQKL